MARTPQSPAVKAANVKVHAQSAADAASRILTAIASGQSPTLADAKVLEAAGCYIRRNGVEA